MARARVSNTGRGNYPASRLGGNAATIKGGIKSIPKLKQPNRYMTENSYKMGIKKQEENNE